MKAINASVTFWVEEDADEHEIDRLVLRLGDSLGEGDYGPDKALIVKADEGITTSWEKDKTGQ